MHAIAIYVENHELTERKIRASVLQNILTIPVVPNAPMETKVVMNRISGEIRTTGETVV